MYPLSLVCLNTCHLFNLPQLPPGVNSCQQNEHCNNFVPPLTPAADPCINTLPYLALYLVRKHSQFTFMGVIKQLCMREREREREKERDKFFHVSLQYIVVASVLVSSRRKLLKHEL